MKPHEFQRELLSQIAPEIERRAIMSPEELKHEELQAQNEYLLKQQESAQVQSQEQQALKGTGNGNCKCSGSSWYIG